MRRVLIQGDLIQPCCPPRVSQGTVGFRAMGGWAKPSTMDGRFKVAAWLMPCGPARPPRFLRLKQPQTFSQHIALGEKPALGDQSLDERCQIRGDVDCRGVSGTHTCAFHVNA